MKIFATILRRRRVPVNFHKTCDIHLYGYETTALRNGSIGFGISYVIFRTPDKTNLLMFAGALNCTEFHSTHIGSEILFNLHVSI